jgi:hypothetical protein
MSPIRMDPWRKRSERFFFYGYAIYDDIFGDTYTRGFCLKIFPNGNQSMRGGDAYNYAVRVKTRDFKEPKDDDQEAVEPS